MLKRSGKTGLFEVDQDGRKISINQSVVCVWFIRRGSSSFTGVTPFQDESEGAVSRSNFDKNKRGIEYILYYTTSTLHGEHIVRIVFELTVHDYIKLFLILAELVGIVVMVFLLVDSLRDKPDKSISKKSAKTKGGLSWLHKNL